MILAPRDGVQVGATIEAQSARAPFPPAVEASIKSYSDMAVAGLPREASKVEVVEAMVSPLRISGKPMIEVIVTYTFFGQSFRMNVLYMPRDKELLSFQFSARAADYAVEFRNFRGSLFTMQGL